MEKTKAPTVPGDIATVPSLDRPQLMYLYTLYDKVAEDSAPPFGAVNDQVAIRNVCRLLVDNPIPEDYILYKVGIYLPGVPWIEDALMEKIPFLANLSSYQAALQEQSQRRTLREVNNDKKNI